MRDKVEPIVERARLIASEFGDVDSVSIDSVEMDGDALDARATVRLRPELSEMIDITITPQRP
jgi:hypothetical protein